MTLETQCHDSRQRAVDDAQADPLASPHRLVCRHGAVDRHRVADAARHRRIHRIAEAGGNLCIRREPPVGQQPQNVAIDWDGFRLLDNQCAAHSPPELLQAVGVRVVPERAGVGRRELIGEALARSDRRLSEPRHAVHSKREPDSMPMNGGVLLEPVFDCDADRLALPHPNLRTRDVACVTPNISMRMRRANERPSRRRGN